MQTPPGFFGKIPSRGDFISRRLPRSFLDPWDVWLQESIAVSREQLGSSWLDLYLTSPIWRFVLSSKICGDEVWAGVLMPSVDAVGRYFPLTAGSPMDASQNAFDVLLRDETWFSRLETLARACLEEDLELEDFDEALGSLGAPDEVGGSSGQSGGLLPEYARSAGAWCLHLGSTGEGRLDLVYPELSRHLAEAVFSRFSVWWTLGSERIPPSLLICRHLPPTEGHAAMLDGDWARWGWFESKISSAPVESNRTQILRTDHRPPE